MSDPVVVENLAQINRSINVSGGLYARAMHKGLLEGAEPVKRDADRLALSEISGMRRARKTERRARGFIGPGRPAWSVQRIGQTVHEVYIAPVERGIKTRGPDPRRRPNFAVLMMGKAYEPALERNRPRIVAVTDNWLDSVTREI